MRFNRRYDRVGHLFQGRFETRVIEGERHLGNVTQYIYENATRVGLPVGPGAGSACPHPHPRPPRSRRDHRSMLSTANG